MKKIVVFNFLLIFAMALTISAQTKKSAVANPNNFYKMETNKTVKDCRSSLKKCGDRALVALDLAGFGGPDSIRIKKEVFYFKNRVGVYLLTINGIKSPVLSGERYRLSFVKKGRSYRFVQLGKQIRCAGGKFVGKWKKDCEIDGSMFPSGEMPNRKSNTRSEVMNADDFRFISINGRAVGEATKPCTESLLECGSTRIGFYGIEGVGGEADNENFKEETFVFADKNTGKNTGIYLLTRKGFQDDSVSGERLRLEFEKKGNAWELVQGGKQFQCARGTNAGKWTKNLCP